MPPVHAAAEQLALFDLGVDLMALKRERDQLNGHATAANTRRALDSDWRHFATWCRRAGRTSLPAAAETVELYLTHCAAKLGHKTSTVQRRAWSISRQHRSAGEISPLGDQVRGLLAAIARKFGTAPQQPAAVTPEELRAMSLACDDSPRGIRDRAILVLGFATGCRRSELVALRIQDVTVAGKGLVVKVRRAKNDQTGRGREIGVFRGRRAETCPVRTLRAWLRLRGPSPGLLFGLTTGESINYVVHQAAKRAGLDPARYSAHSLRAGMCTTAVASGAPESIVMRRSGHKSASSFQRYVRPAEMFASDPLAKAL
ncbi:MAG TPA: site-specific integrase [Bryobacteraceae bacterium]|nr:site-specific integrase [Bryobacteraceae bacterium]